MITALAGSSSLCDSLQQAYLRAPAQLKPAILKQYKSCVAASIGKTVSPTGSKPSTGSGTRSTTTTSKPTSAPWYSTTAGMIGIGAVGLGVVVGGVLLFR